MAKYWVTVTEHYSFTRTDLYEGKDEGEAKHRAITDPEWEGGEGQRQARADYDHTTVDIVKEVKDA